MNIKLIIFSILLAFVVGAGCSTAEIVDSGAVETGDVSVANQGYDSIAYFAAEEATKGSQQFAFFWKGARWLFSSKDNLEKFKLNPEKFAPQFGSHCPVSLANGGTVEGDPRFFKVVNDKLYLFASKDLADQFEKEPYRVLKKAGEKYKNK